MDLPPELAIIHQPVRLRIMTLIFQQGDVGFTEAQRCLSVTPGNLDAHVKRLSDAGFMIARKSLVAGTFEVRMRLSPEGQAAYERYLDVLKAFLGTVEQPA